MSIHFSKSTVLLAAAALFSLACGQEQKPDAIATMNVPLASAELEKLPRLQPYAGTVRAANVSSLSARVVGDVIAVHVSAGDAVRRGQLLIEIDHRDAAAQLDRARAEHRALGNAIESASAAVASAEAQAALAEATWLRFRPLSERGSVSPQEFDEVEARHRSASAELERSRRALAQLTAQRDAAAAATRQAETHSAYTRIVAPFDGVISARLVDPGAQAAPGMPLLAIEGGSHYRAEAMVDEAAAITPGDEVIIETGSVSLRARVSQVIPSIDPSTRTRLVKIDLPPNTAWRSGAFARVLVAHGDHQAITIPSTAIVRRGQLTTVYAVANDGTAQLRLVTIAGSHTGRVEVLSGLAAGERVIAQPPATMREGIRVTGVGA